MNKQPPLGDIRIFAAGLMVGLGVTLAGGPDAAAQPGNARWHLLTGTPQDLPLEPLTIESGGRKIALQVEFAQTPDQRQIGMMFEDRLAPDRGMLFTHPGDRPASFWMRNTYIPLDLIFITGDGRIESIAHQAKPLDETPIRSQGPVAGVLEIAGGRARDLGLQPGDLVRHRLFGTAD